MLKCSIEKEITSLTIEYLLGCDKALSEAVVAIIDGILLHEYVEGYPPTENDKNAILEGRCKLLDEMKAEPVKVPPKGSVKTPVDETI